MELNTRDDEGDVDDGSGGRRRRRLAICSALLGLAGGWLLWTSPVTPTISVPSPSALRPSSVNTVFLLSVIENIKNAKPVISRERERSAAEREAFARFSQRVEHIDAARSPAAGGAGDGGVLALDAGVEDTRLDVVAEAYRETVLSVPHYDEEYGEPALDHMAEEFGEEIAATLDRGQRFTPQLRDVLVEAATEATTQRDALVRTLDQETDSLSRAERVLKAVESELDGIADGPLHYLSFEELTDAWVRLASLEHRCENLLKDRQKRIQQGHPVGGPSLHGMHLHRYLYQSIDTDHPILADGTAVVDRVRSAQQRMARAISRRV